MKYIILELRVHHYIKNLLVFVALVCSGCLFDQTKLIPGVWGFLSFCMASSAMYVFNDIQDIKADRAHPTKCNRPITSGAMSVKQAWMMVAILIVLCVIFNMMAFTRGSTLVLLSYLIINIGYNLGLKNIPLVDIIILVADFFARILYGAIITQIEISSWLYLTVIAIAFYLSLGKRRNELKWIQAGITRRVLDYYNEGFLDKNMYMFLGMANVFYALWTMDKAVAVTGNCKCLLWTVPFVLLIFMKYSLDIEGDSDGDPVEVLVHDKVLMLLCVVYVLIMFGILYM